MMQRLTRSQGEALTALIGTLRKDWDLPGIRAALRNAAELGSGMEVAIAACRVAAKPEARTPALIAEPGAHWQGTAVGQRQAPVMCPDHPDERLGLCRACRDAAAPMPAEVREAARAARRSTPKPRTDTHQPDPQRIEEVRAQADQEQP